MDCFRISRRRRFIAHTALMLAALVVRPIMAPAQTSSDNFATVINVPEDAAPGGIGSDTQVNVYDGGYLPQHFSAGNYIFDADDPTTWSHTNMEVNIYGGGVGYSSEAGSDSTFNLIDGSLGAYFHALEGSTVNVFAGVIGKDFVARAGSAVNISGGSIGRKFIAGSNSSVLISGGTFGPGFVAAPGSRVTISGGTYWRDFSASGPDVRLVAGDFNLNGTPIVDHQEVTVSATDVLSGTFAGGEHFVFSGQQNDRLANIRIEQTTLPEINTSPITLNSPSTERGLRPGQIIVVESGGELPDDFIALGSRVDLRAGGKLHHTELSASELNLYDGTVEGSVIAFAGSDVNVHSGTVTQYLTAFSGSTADMRGGRIERVYAGTGSNVRVSGGLIRQGLFASGGKVEITGGVVDDEFQVSDGGHVIISGGQIPGLAAQGDGTMVEITTGSFSAGISDGATAHISGADTNLFSVGGRDAGDIHITGDARVSQLITNGGTTTISGGRVDDYFHASRGTINVSGGSVRGFASNGSTVNISAGGLSASYEEATTNSEINITGGGLGFLFKLGDGTVVNNSAGYLGTNIDAQKGSTVNVSGGSLGRQFEARNGSFVNLSGGRVGSYFKGHEGSTVNIYGSEFKLNGAPLSTDTTISLADAALLTGTFEDGSPLIFSTELGDTLSEIHLKHRPVPAVDPQSQLVNSAAAPNGVRAGETVTVVENGDLGATFTMTGGTLNIIGGVAGSELKMTSSVVNLSAGQIGRSFSALHGSILNMTGGQLDQYGSAHAGSVVNVSGGTVEKDFRAYAGSTVNVSGGLVKSSFDALSGSTLNVSGGTVEHLLVVESEGRLNLSGGTLLGTYMKGGSVATISGGRTENRFYAYDGSLVSISGGSVNQLTAQAGSEISQTGGHLNYLVAEEGSQVHISGGALGRNFTAAPGSDVNLFGGEYYLNGHLLNEDTTVSLTDNDILTGTLVDGSVFVLSARAQDKVHGVRLTPRTLPAASPAEIVVSEGVGPQGLRRGQSLTVSDAGALPADFAVVHATLNVAGGVVGPAMEIVDGVVNVLGGNVGSDARLHAGGRLNVLGGHVGSRLVNQAEVVVTGGEVGDSLRVERDGKLQVDGGRIGELLTVYNGGRLKVSDGSFGNEVGLRYDSTTEISGGKFGHLFTVHGGVADISGGSFGKQFTVLAGSGATLFGGEFSLNGQPLATDQAITLGPADVLSGTLADGSPFIFSPQSGVGARYYANSQPSWISPIIFSVVAGPGGFFYDDFNFAPAGDRIDGLKLRVVDLPALRSDVVIAGDSPLRGLRAGESLTLQTGQHLPTDFQAVGATLRIEGGSVGEGLETIETKVEMTGGAMDGNVVAFTGSQLNISGGSINGHLTLLAGSNLDISNGSIDSLEALPGSEIAISGGAAVDSLRSSADSVVTITGGSVDRLYVDRTGTVNLLGGVNPGSLRVSDGSTVNVFGDDFTFDGEPLADILGAPVMEGVAFDFAQRDGVLAGRLADGSAFSFRLLRDRFYADGVAHGARVTLTRVAVAPEPNTTCLLGLIGLVFAMRRKFHNTNPTHA